MIFGDVEAGFDIAFFRDHCEIVHVEFVAAGPATAPAEDPAAGRGGPLVGRLGSEAESAEDEGEEGSESCKRASSDGKALLDSGPDGDVESIPCKPLMTCWGVSMYCDLHKKSLDLSRGTNGRRATTAKLALQHSSVWSRGAEFHTYMQPIASSGMRAILVLRLSWRPAIKKAGNSAKVKSVMMAKPLYKKPRPMIMSSLIQVPSCALFQKKVTGLHWKSVTKKNVPPATIETNIAA